MMRIRARLIGIATVVAVVAVGVGAGVAAASELPQAAPSSCRVFNPLFDWEAGQERSLRAADNHCDAAPGRRAWLVFQRNGNLGFYLDGRQLWDAGTKGRANRLVEQGNGELEIVDGQGRTLWATRAPSAGGYQPHPNGGFGVGFESGGGEDFTHWTESEGLCGPGGACGEVLWVSGKGPT